MYQISKVIFVVLFLFINLYADYYDSGMIEFSQPDSTTFTGRGWGDEFAFLYETQTGYRFVLFSDGYYYYAVLDENGEYTVSDKKVGIDTPLAESYYLEQSAERKAEIRY